MTEDDVQALRLDFYDQKVKYVDAVHEAYIDKDKLMKEIEGVKNQCYR